jgi:Na+-translocating ferredoxin:NAD+ oxidoreductase RnfD subunit
MEVSSTSIKAASATVAAISQGFVFGFHALIAAFAADLSAVVVEAIVLRFPYDLVAVALRTLDRCQA